ncbi:MAG: ATP-binding protein, partial [Candidatus Margulisiibacteriota bacterium]
MLTNLTIINIFTEIFAAGILFAGALTLLKTALSGKKLKALFFGLIFFSLFGNAALTVASQIMFNLGRDLSELILVHKWIYVNLVVCAVLLWCFIVERFKFMRLRWSFALFVLLGGFLIFQISQASVNLIYREEVVEPIVFFSSFIPVKPLFSVLWGVLAILSFVEFAKFSAPEGERKLSFLLGFSSLLFLASMLCSNFYLRFGEVGYLVSSWSLFLLASLGFLLAEIIPSDSLEARRPFSFFQSRILFKLLLVLVLLVVILFEATTLATMNVSRSALSRAITASYFKTAEELAGKINALDKLPSQATLQQMISAGKQSGKETVFVVDKEGKIIAHPDSKRAIQGEIVTSNQAVTQVLTGKRGGGEFRNEIGSRMVGAFVPVPKYALGVVVEEPIASAYAELRLLETNSLLFVIMGIVLTSIVGVFFARSIERPIKELTSGTEAVSRGDLKRQVVVDSKDELGRLAQAFNQMTKDLRDSQERLILSEKLASLGTMAAGMAHEIKNPLVSIRTFTQLLEQKWQDEEFRKKFSSIIPHEIERINRIAESLLKFGRPMKPELSKVDINGLLDEVLLLFESETKKHNVRVTKTLAALPEITGDAGQLQQVFVNIVKNAIEAMQGKGGELIVKSDVGEVMKLGKLGREGKKRGEEMVWGEEEELQKPMPAVFIEISDTGEGISDENLKNLFDPFFTTKMTGTGMGLPITLRIIEEHKGSIKVKSQVGKGTSFIITL